jgi:1-acyl-sn-glycerol-3-phosphate acyltransferase
VTIFIRSLLFNAAFYLVTALIILVTLPVYFFLPQGFATGVVRLWAKTGVFLLRTIAGTRCELRGRENVPPGAIIVASKHQSMFETFALWPLFPDPTYVMKAEIRKIPFFGWFAVKAGMILVDRKRGTTALRQMAARAREEVAKGRQILIFPEGTRRPPGAPPDYQPGVAFLYRSLGVPVLPMALNSGLYWPRRSFLHYPGTIVVEFLTPIPPGLEPRLFMDKLEEEIETASDRLLVEAYRAEPRPPFPVEAGVRAEELLNDENPTWSPPTSSS